MKSFYALIATLDQATGDERAQIEKVIWATFGATQAVLALDMSGFSLLVRRDGILSYLCKIQQMQRVTRPIVRAHNGEVVKYEADNLLAVFADCNDAVRAAVEINRAFVRPAGEEEPLQVSIGIDFGKFLLVQGGDGYGDAINRAHKLGEDLARAKEILITDEVRQRLSEHPQLSFSPEEVSAFGMVMTVFRVGYH